MQKITCETREWQAVILNWKNWREMFLKRNC